MRRAVIHLVVLLVVLAVAGAAPGQPAGKVPALGVLWTSRPASSAVYREAFVKGLAEVGYTEGQTVVLHHRYAEEKLERLASFAAELVRLGVDVLVTQGTPSARAAKQATTTTPIVMFNVGDPVGANLVASLARPGGNMTGLTLVAGELAVKRLELLREAIPKLARVAVFWEPAGVTGGGTILQDVKDAGRSLGLQLHLIEVRGAADFERAFTTAVGHRAEALLVMPSPILNYHRKALVDLAARHRLPASYQAREFAEVGGLMSYGPDLPALARRAASYVDRILKGARPADLPVERPTRFELVVNLKTARALGLTLAPALLLRADQVIE